MYGIDKNINLWMFRYERMKNKMLHPHHHRNMEIDFVLKYLVDLRWLLGKKKSKLVVLDVGCTGSLLLHEIDKRGYIPYGLDIRPYHTVFPKHGLFFQGDITHPNLEDYFRAYTIYFVVALSTIEHVGLGGYGDPVKPNGDRLALEGIYKILHPDGYFIMTIPIKYWETKSGRGYTLNEFLSLINGLFSVLHFDILGGQICALMVKCQSSSQTTAGI